MSTSVILLSMNIWILTPTRQVAMLSTLIAPVPAMFCSNWLDLDQSVATPAQNSYAIKIQPKGTKSPRLGHFLFFAGLGPKRKFIFISKGNSADSHMWEVFTYVNIWGDSLMLWRKKYFRKFKNNNINYNLKELFKNFD